jgi:hypothetical protein
MMSVGLQERVNVVILEYITFTINHIKYFSVYFLFRDYIRLFIDYYRVIVMMSVDLHERVKVVVYITFIINHKYFSVYFLYIDYYRFYLRLYLILSG